MGQFVSLKMPVEQWFSYIYAGDMPKNCPRYIQDMPEIRASFAQGMGIHIEKVGQNVTGEGASVGHFVAGEEMGHFVAGTICRMGICRPKCQLNNGFLLYMPGIWPKIAQDISKICPRYA